MAAARMPQQARSQLRRDALLQAAVELVATQQRMPKSSYHWYRNLIAAQRRA